MKLKSDDLLQTLAWAGVEEIRQKRAVLKGAWWRPGIMLVIPYAYGRFHSMGPRPFEEWRLALKAEIAARRERGQW